MQIDSPTKAKAGGVDDAFMLAFLDAWKRKDTEAILGMVTEDVVLESGFGPEVCGKRFVGKAAFREGVVRYFKATADATSSNRSYAILGDKGFTEATRSFVDKDGKRVSMRVCDLFDFRDGKVSSKRAYVKQQLAE